MESWNGAMEWSFGVDYGVEWSQILGFCHPFRLTDIQRRSGEGSDFGGNQYRIKFR